MKTGSLSLKGVTPQKYGWDEVEGRINREHEAPDQSKQRRLRGKTAIPFGMNHSTKQVQC
jgi:hypothetical protein